MTTWTPVAGQGVEVDGQGGDRVLPSPVFISAIHPKWRAMPAHQLDVEVALAEHPPGRLAHEGERLDQQVLEALAVVEALLEDRR